MTIGPILICSGEPMRAASALERADSASIMTVTGNREIPGLQGGAARHLLQFDGQQEQRPVHGVIDDEGHHVGGGEPGPSRTRSAAAWASARAFLGYESCKQQHADDHRGQRDGRAQPPR